MTGSVTAHRERAADIQGREAVAKDRLALAHPGEYFRGTAAEERHLRGTAQCRADVGGPHVADVQVHRHVRGVVQQQCAHSVPHGLVDHQAVHPAVQGAPGVQQLTLRDELEPDAPRIRLDKPETDQFAERDLRVGTVPNPSQRHKPRILFIYHVSTYTAYNAGMGTVAPPRTADRDRFRFRAGRPSLDLCSTVLWRHIGPIEQLGQPGDLAGWLVESGLWARPHPVTDADLRAFRALRESLYQIFRARILGSELPGVAVVNQCAEHPGPVPRLSPEGDLRWVTGDPVPAALSAVARDGIELLTGHWSGRLRECAAPDCAFLFADTSRPGRRRWCAHNRCGNRQHVRAHRARHRADSA